MQGFWTSFQGSSLSLSGVHALLWGIPRLFFGGVPSLQIASSQTWLFQTWLFALFCALFRSFVLLRLRSFALLRLRSFACFCVRPRLERPRLGTADRYSIAYTILFDIITLFLLLVPERPTNIDYPPNGSHL